MSVMPARAWADEDLAVELAACPGKRLLVIGNHDVDDFEQIGRGGFGPQYAAAVCDTNPVLVLTHVPLRRIPPTAVNGARPPARPAGYHRPPMVFLSTSMCLVGLAGTGPGRRIMPRHRLVLAAGAPSPGVLRLPAHPHGPAPGAGLRPPALSTSEGRRRSRGSRCGAAREPGCAARSTPVPPAKSSPSR